MTAMRGGRDGVRVRGCRGDFNPAVYPKKPRSFCFFFAAGEVAMCRNKNKNNRICELRVHAGLWWKFGTDFVERASDNRPASQAWCCDST